MKLYDINAQLEQLIENAVDQETGEIVNEQLMQEYDKLSMERDAKVENIGLFIKNLKAEAEAVKAEKQTFERRQKTLENKCEFLKNYLLYCLHGEKFKTDKVVISYRKYQSVEIIDQSTLDGKYLIPQEPKVDKMSIKSDILNGVKVDGASLVTKDSILIK